MSVLDRAITKMTTSSWFRKVGPKVVPKMDLAVHKLTGGRLIPSGTYRSTLLLTATGHKSGQPRTVPLLYMPDGDRFVVIGSNYGRDNHPAWSTNLLANPHATVELPRRRRIPVVARLLEGDERREVWEQVCEYYDNYARYEERVEREIRVFALEPQD